VTRSTIELRGLCDLIGYIHDKCHIKTSKQKRISRKLSASLCFSRNIKIGGEHIEAAMKLLFILLARKNVDQTEFR
jgi:hypothetical protein